MQILSVTRVTKQEWHINNINNQNQLWNTNAKRSPKSKSKARSKSKTKYANKKLHGITTTLKNPTDREIQTQKDLKKKPKTRRQK